MKRPLTDQDSTARHKYSFDMYVSPIRSIFRTHTPFARHDFKFKDYAPWVFRECREDHSFGVTLDQRRHYFFLLFTCGLVQSLDLRCQGVHTFIFARHLSHLHPYFTSGLRASLL
ncbi:hypothetical protein EDB19DRAFT_393791 [Suillus lakei]|nr:hypothetical protein EDB19DRAFT_393791 [Suillus lakei]